MSKKWITFIAAAVVGAFVLMPAASAVVVPNCQVSLIGSLSWTANTGSNGDPRPLSAGALVSSVITQSSAVAGGYQVSAEGLGERVQDLLVYDGLGNQTTNGGNGCFQVGTVITITYNGVAVLPALGSIFSQAYLDIFDSAGNAGLNLSQATVTNGFAADQTTTIVTLVVNQKGSAAGDNGGAAVPYGFSGGTGSALRIKNFRFDATQTPGTAATITISSTFANPPAAPAPVSSIILNDAGAASNIVATKNITMVQTEPNVLPGTFISASNPSAATGFQNSGAGLVGGYQSVGFNASPVITTPADLAMRAAHGSCTSQTLANDTCASGVANDIATGDTSVIFGVTTIPTGVTVTFPASWQIIGNNGNAIFTLMRARSATLSNGGTNSSLGVIYDTVTSFSGTSTWETADNVDPGSLSGTGVPPSVNPNCTGSTSASAINLNPWSRCNSNPKIGVKIGTNSGIGSATLSMAYGPGATALSNLGTLDDVTTSLYPRYTGSSDTSGSTDAAGHGFVNNTVATRYIEKLATFFTVLPTRTALLFPFVSTVGSFNTGLSIANTCADTGAFLSAATLTAATTPTCNQTGPVTFFFFGVDSTTPAGCGSEASNCTVYTGSLSTDIANGGKDVSSACRGFDATGKVAPGKEVACSVANLLPLLPGAPKGFDGYVIAVGLFNNGHGFSAQFNAAGSPFGANPALVLVDSSFGRPTSNESLGQ